MRRAMTGAAIAAVIILAACGGAEQPGQSPEKTTPAQQKTQSPTERETAAAAKLTASLRGPDEVPPGDPDGSGAATFDLNPATGDVCYTINVERIGAPTTAAHIHEGRPGTAGAAVVPLEPPKEGRVETCAKADPTIVQRIIADPSGFYVNVHNQEFPGGAVRGQLQAA